MFFAILDNRTGESFVRRMSPSENKPLELMVQEWIEKEYYGVCKLKESDGYIPRGCGDFMAEIRRTKVENGCCICSFDFYMQYDDGE